MCNACGVAFSVDEIRAHYATPLHHTNLKRRVADLPPITASAFARLAAESDARESVRAAEAEAIVYVCDACGKSFASEGQFAAHNKSTKHYERVRALLRARRAAEAAEKSGAGAAADSGTAGGAAADGESDDEVIELTASHCVFCWKSSADLEANLLHMREVHSFFIPDVTCCDDPSGLVLAMHDKVVDARECLWCDSRKQYADAAAVQAHMADKGHARIRYEEDHQVEEWEAFFDYAAYEAAPAAAVINALGELVLPSGSVAVTKDIARLYRQAAARPPSTNDEAVRAVLDRIADAYYAESGDSLVPRVEPRTTADLVKAASAAARRVGTRGNGTDARAQKRAEERASRFSLRVGMGQNDIRREYFRVATTLTGRTG